MQISIATRIFAIQLLTFATITPASAATSDTSDIGGNWLLHYSISDGAPITIRCELVQMDMNLTGTCTHETENAAASQLIGEIAGDVAYWSYAVGNNDQAGRVDVTATILSATELSGTLSLSGTMAPFTATRE